jgi:hypothetical protein
MDELVLQAFPAIVEFPVQLVFFSFPVLGYALYQTRKEIPMGEILDRLEWRGCSPRQVLLAIGVAVLVGGGHYPINHPYSNLPENLPKYDFL